MVEFSHPTCLGAEVLAALSLSIAGQAEVTEEIDRRHFDSRGRGSEVLVVIVGV